MTVISDTSPLHYLVAAGCADILAGLFTNIHVPPNAIQELSHASTPPAIRRWVSSRPAWFVADSLAKPLDVALLASRARGEAEAMMRAKGFRIHARVVARFQVLLVSRYAFPAK